MSKIIRHSGIMAIMVAGVVICNVSPAGAQSKDEITKLRSEIESLKSGQQEMQKNIQIIKDILMGKQPPLENVFISTDNAPALGEKDAKVTIVEFSDYQCPFCGRYSTQTMSQVLDEYVKTGKVRYVFRNFPLEQLHPLAMKAAEAAECAGEQGKYWEMHDRLFKNQQNLEAKELLGHAVVVGLDQAKFQQCLDGGKYAALIKNDIADGQKSGVRGTPTFFFGLTSESKGSKIKAVKLLSGAQPISTFKETIDDLLNPPKEDSKQKNQSE